MMLLAFSQIKRYHPTLKYSPDDSNVANRISKVPDKSYMEMIKSTDGSANNRRLFWSHSWLDQKVKLSPQFQFYITWPFKLSQSCRPRDQSVCHSPE